MQLQDIQAFVRPHAIFPYWRVRSAELSEIGEDRLAEALLLPNCTPEVADAVKARMCEGGEVRDLRLDVAERGADIALRWKGDLARALDMPEGRPFAEYVKAVSGLMSEHTAAKKRLAPEGTVSAQEYENVRADNERLRERNSVLEASLKRAVGRDARASAYNQGCADTVAAFRKAQGGE